jgi:hypothetical protein
MVLPESKCTAPVRLTAAEGNFTGIFATTGISYDEPDGY